MPARVFLTFLAAVLTVTSLDTSALFDVSRAASAETVQHDGMSNRLETAMQSQRERLGRLDSDDEALVLYRSDLARALAVEDTVSLLGPKRTGRRRPESVARPVLKVPALQLVRELAYWGTARDLLEAADAGEVAPLTALERREREREDWLLKVASGGVLARALRVASVIAALQGMQASTDGDPSAHIDFAAYLDQTYPALATGPQSWVAVAEDGGAAAVRQRMVGYWERDGRRESSEGAMRWYFQTRLRPVFLAQVSAYALLAVAEAQQRAGEILRRLQSWREDWSAARGRARLCGTWTWIVHNHQNHQDHKMMVTFPPPDLTPDGPAFPKAIVVLGDSVYLRWEFPGGYQEDSLLLSAKDQRLEGTFVNSSGPYGAITGKKIKRCSPQ